MRGSHSAIKIALVALVMALVASGAAAQGEQTPQPNIAPPGPLTLTAPVITSVTPGNNEAVIGFQAPRDPSPSNPIREYIVSCDQPRQPEAGTVEITADAEAVVRDQILLQGLENGSQYVCTMKARAVDGSIIPRSINSPDSNPTPPFIPTAAGGSTIFVNPDGTAALQPQAPAAEPAAEVSGLPAAPIITTVTPGPDSVTIAFEPVRAGEGASPITGYTASCQSNADVQASAEGTAPVKVGADATEIKVTGLAPGDYTCSLSADTAAGAGRAVAQAVTVGPKAAEIEPLPTEPEDSDKPPAVPPVVTTPPEKESKPGAVQTPATPPPPPKASALRAAGSIAAAVVVAVALMA